MAENLGPVIPLGLRRSTISGSSSVRRSCIRDHVCPIVAGCCRWQRSFFGFVQIHHLFDNLAKFSKNGLLIIPMASTIKKARATADEALIFFGPFNYFYISISGIHDLDSSIALLTARSWYFFASSPAFPEIVNGFATCGWTKFRWLPLPPRSSKPAAFKSAMSSRIFLGTPNSFQKSGHLSSYPPPDPESSLKWSPILGPRNKLQSANKRHLGTVSQHDASRVLPNCVSQKAVRIQ